MAACKSPRKYRQYGIMENRLFGVFLGAAKLPKKHQNH
jgi:hypothetical protein